MGMGTFGMDMSPRTYPLIIEFQGKHGDDHYIVNNDTEFFAVFNQEFANRKDWFEDFEIEEMESNFAGACKSFNQRGYFFMDQHRDYEYEGFDLITPSEIK